MTIAVRRATIDDFDELVRLAVVMFESVGYDASGAEWRVRARTVMADGFADERVAGFAVERPDGAGGLAAAAMASINQRLPTPGNVDGRVVYVQWVATDEEFRRRGAGRALMEAIVAWARDRGVAYVDLHTSPAGETLYRSMGFAEHVNPELRRRVI